jgi:predicted  nucleic acid-binding Zn-ribbon protein
MLTLQRDTQRELDRESLEHRNEELELEIAKLRDKVKEQDKRMLDIANKADALTEQCVAEKAAAAAALKTANASHSGTKRTNTGVLLLAVLVQMCPC